ncbi:MAG: transcriptional repressor TraM [Pseudomonadota bacterium]
MATKEDTRSHDNADVVISMTNLIAPLSSDQIEKLTIEAIHEHRAALARAEAAYESWQTAEAAEADTAADLLANYTRLMLAAHAQQLVLATLIDRLGFIPRVLPS